ncbi:MAG: type II CAAX endopeptidase family protein [Micrococcaceae bacterium]
MQEISRPPRGVRYRKNYPLDENAFELREDDPVPWGFRPIYAALASVLLGMSSLIFLIVLHSYMYGNQVLSTPMSMAYSALGTLIMGIGTYYAARPIALRNGGWGRTFGVTKFKFSYLVLGIITWAAFLLINKVISKIFAYFQSNAAQQGSNVYTTGNSPSIVISTLLATALVAPIVEEFIFRGVILRTFMHKYGFWLSAFLTSLIFALFHVSQVTTVFGALVLGTTLFVLAMLISWVDRLTNSIVPGIIVHMLNNGVVLLMSFYSL